MDFSVMILGSGAATPTMSRHCSAQIVSVGGERLLVDCGESTQNQLRHFHQKIQSIKTVFISHLHGDHFFGLPGLLSTMHLCGRTEPVKVFAPTGAKASLNTLFDVSGTELRYELDVEEMDFEGVRIIYRGKGFKVKSFPMQHSIPTYGFLFEEDEPLFNLRKNVKEKYNMTYDQCMRVKEGEDLVLETGEVVANAELTLPRRMPRRYAYCCDTAYDERLVEIISGVDLLCMDSTFDTAFLALAEERCHCTAAQAASIALQAGVRELMLTHFSARYKETGPLLEEARAVFPETFCASDGFRYVIMPRVKQ